MKNNRILLIFILVTLASAIQADTYDPVTSILTLQSVTIGSDPSVKTGSIIYTDVGLKIEK
jgi:hypothetical protein